MKLTILLALLTAGLNQTGITSVAEIAYLAASAVALLHGSRAITDAMQTVRTGASQEATLTVPAV